jgi:D-3-phosphoglycerate dehydrogenase
MGLGNIGRLVAKRLSGFDVRLLGYDPVISAERTREMNVCLADVEKIFRESDYVTLHMPENDETKGMIGEKLVSLMKDGATIINCARAGVLDEEAFRAQKDKKGLRLLNDVYAKDAEGEKSVTDIADIMLPHLGASTKEANLNAAKRAAEQLIDLDYKGITSCIVNREIPEGLDEPYCELTNTLARLARCLVGRETSLRLIETSFYGELEPFADWLVVPVVAGIWKEFEPSMDFTAAREFLAENGIEYVNRKPDPQKGYGNSITIDLMAEVNPDKMRRMSLRGTVAEGVQMVSRINEFNKLYFEPVGHTVFFLYEDRPGVLGAIGVKLAGAGINIEDVRNPHDVNTNRSLAIMRISKRASDELMDGISEEIQAIAAFSIKL